MNQKSIVFKKGQSSNKLKYINIVRIKVSNKT